MASQDDDREETRDEPQDPLSRLLTPLGFIFGIAFLFITIFSFYEVVMRYVFNAPTIWVHETTTAMTALCFAFAGAYCLGTNRHIRVVLLYDAVSPRTRRILDVVICFIGAAACALMAWAAYGFAYKALFSPSGGFHLETTGSAWNPPTPAIVKCALFIILCIMCAQFLLQALGHLRREASAESDKAASHEHFDDV